MVVESSRQIVEFVRCAGAAWMSSRFSSQWADAARSPLANGRPDLDVGSVCRPSRQTPGVGNTSAAHKRYHLNYCSFQPADTNDVRAEWSFSTFEQAR